MKYAPRNQNQRVRLRRYKCTVIISSDEIARLIALTYILSVNVPHSETIMIRDKSCPLRVSFKNQQPLTRLRKRLFPELQR